MWEKFFDLLNLLIRKHLKTDKTAFKNCLAEKASHSAMLVLLKSWLSS